MAHALDLRKKNNKIVKLVKINFVDQQLPFSLYLPLGGKLPRSIDMIVGSVIAWDHFLIPVGVGQSPMRTINFDTALANDCGKLWFSVGDSSDLSINHLIADSQPVLR